MTKLKLVSLMIIAYSGCISKEQRSSISCRELPEIYSSYKEAFEKINAVADFEIKESVNTHKSSWMRGASYLSCDGRIGFLIFNTDSKIYIHQGVPLEIWKEFKSTDSFGQYWNKYLKSKYHLRIME